MTAVDMSDNRVLALAMRPKDLSECVGQGELVEMLRQQFAANRIPHTIMISGPVGSGKTTLARILALALQKSSLSLTADDWASYKSLDIREINAANKNGVEDVRQLVESMKYKPMQSRCKVVIWDEAHQMTQPAQNALLPDIEDTPPHVYYIFCTSQVGKMIPAVQRRCYSLSPSPLDDAAVLELLEAAKARVGFAGEMEPFQKALQIADIKSPGLIMRAVEKYFGGMGEIESVFDCEPSKLDTMAICRSIAAGDWKVTAELMKTASKADTVMVRACALGYLKKVLLTAQVPKAIALSKAIKAIAAPESAAPDCLPSLLASLCLACGYIKDVVTEAKKK